LGSTLADADGAAEEADEATCEETTEEEIVLDGTSESDEATL